MLACACILIAAGTPTPSFNTDVLPILSNNCFLCHGPDKGTREADMRLDIPEGALAAGLILPSDNHASTLLQRITSPDAKHRMPPLEMDKQLTEAQINVLRRWIDDGAHYEPHWAFVTPTQTLPPHVDDWARNEVDHFIKARLDTEGLAPNAEANQHTLIRRVTLDLTGLPPTPAEVDAFLQDDRPDAYAQLVDRLLASKHFGEHQARPWLDLARYADSQGFEKDNLRTMWRYRDWVIDAFNADMPFDQFTLEQIAGDLLPDATLDQRIATGFHRNTQTNTEGGTDNEEFRSGAVIDRVNTTMQGWMGLTAACAQCHDHKYDPLTQQEYYELYAFFNQTKDADLDNDAPFIKAPTARHQADLDAATQTIAAFNESLATPDDALREGLAQWLSTRCTQDDWNTAHPIAAAAINGTTYAMLGDGTIEAGGPVPEIETTTVHLRTSASTITGIRLDVLDDGLQGPGRAANRNFVVNDITIATSTTQEPVRFSTAEASFNQGDFSASEAVDDDPGAGSGWAIAGGVADQHAVFTLSEPLDVPDDGRITITLVQSHGKAHTLGRFRLSVTHHAKPAAALASGIEALASLPERTETQWGELATAALNTAPPLSTLNATHTALKAAQKTAEDKIPTALVFEALPEDTQRTTLLFVRGTFLAPDQERGQLHPGIPQVLHELATSDAATRLDLAHWLTAHDNPLTARVQVNRVWERLFGNGLVATVDDFGVQGERPSHAALLDWLSVHWQHTLGWSTKALLRVLVTSATYRQSAEVDPAAFKRDPKNRLLSRAPRVRLSAEQLRDTALAAAGLLKTDRVGGPSVMPRVPDGMLPQAFTSFVQQASTGDDLYRRGLYTQWRRTGHYPTFATFDAPSREFCLVARERSNTPLQALAMLNDAVFVEAAQGLARRALDSDGDAIATAFEFAMARRPTTEERAVLQEVHDAAAASGATAGRLALATDPLGPLPEGMDPLKAIAMTVTCNVILNLDEFVNRP